MEVRSRFLLVAVFGVWTGFLGFMAVAATDEAVPQMLGVVAVVCGILVTFVGLGTVVRDRLGDGPRTARYVDDN